MIPLNAFSTLTIQHIVQKGDELNRQTFQRGISKLGRVWKMDYEPWIRPGGFPQRPPSKLPPPGDEHLSIGLGETLGTGRVGTVHEVVLLTHQTELPLLVAKISRRKKSENMAQEAWFYEELEQVQGIAVPRCYGFFQARVKEEEGEVWMWKDKTYIESVEVDECGLPISKEETGDPTLLSVLLLERLGSGIPIGYKDFDYSPIKADVYEVYDDLARLGIEHVDFRWSNILSIFPNSVQGDPGPACPNHGHPHLWRIIDLDMARKVNCNEECLTNSYSSHLRRLFNNAPDGIVIEPWE